MPLPSVPPRPNYVPHVPPPLDVTDPDVAARAALLARPDPRQMLSHAAANQQLDPEIAEVAQNWPEMPVPPVLGVPAPQPAPMLTLGIQGTPGNGPIARATELGSDAIAAVINGDPNVSLLLVTWIQSVCEALWAVRDGINTVGGVVNNMAEQQQQVMGMGMQAMSAMQGKNPLQMIKALSSAFGGQ